MSKKFKIYGAIFASGVALLGTVLATRGVHDSFLFHRAEADSKYNVTLDSSNAYTGGATKSIVTSAGVNTVTFNYTNCSSKSGYHVAIASGGSIKNENAMLSVTSLYPVFDASSGASLQFSASYDGKQWGEFASLTSNKYFDLESQPYFFEIKAVGGTVNLKSLVFNYACSINPNAEPQSTPATYFEKVTDELDDYSGEYLIVYEDTPRAFDGSLEIFDVVKNNFTVTITNNQIPYNTNTSAKSFEFTKNDDNTYAIKSKSGYFIGGKSKTIFTSTTYDEEFCAHTINIYDDDDAELTANDFNLRFNSASNQLRFRYYNGSCERIALYKANGGGASIGIPEYQAQLNITDNNADNYLFGHSFDESFDTENFSASVLMSNGKENPINLSELTIDIEKNGTHYSTSDKLNLEGVYNITISFGDTLAPVKYQITISKTAVSSVSFDKQAIALKPGDQSTLTVTILPENAFDKSLTWTTDKSSVATVTDPGVITAVGEGTAIITAISNSNNDKKATCTVTVSSSSPVDPGMKTAYEAAEAAGSTATSSYYTFTGVVIGKRYNSSTNNDIYVQSGDYGMDVFKYTGYNNVSKGDEVTVKAKVKCYNGLPETDTINSLTINGKGILPNQNIITTAAGLESAKINTLVGVTGTINSIKKGSSTTTLSNLSLYDATNNDYNIVLTTSSGDITVYLKKGTFSDKIDVLKTFSTGDVMTITDGIRGIYNTTDQVLVVTESVITKGTPVHVDVTGITVSPTSTDVSVNGTTQLTATIAPGNASNKGVTWSSSDSTVASVDQTGLVTGHIAGQSATIYATSVENNNIQGHCTVSVKTISVQSVSLNKETAEMYIGGNDLNLVPTVLPENATNKSVEWSSSNASVASVNELGVVKAIGAGTAIITVKTVDGNHQASCTISVSEAPTNGETSINKFETISGNIDDHISYQGLKGTGTSVAQVNSEELRIYQNGGYLLLTSDQETYITKVTIGSSMSTTVSYQTSGLNRSSRALAEDTNYELAANNTIEFDELATDEFKIICNGSDKNHRLYVNYIDVEYAYFGGSGTTGDVSVTGVSVSPKSLKLTTGDTSTLSALLSPNNATNKNVIWSSDNINVVTVSNTGKVTAVGVGSASVTATTVDGEFTDSCNISVAAKVISVSSISLNKTSVELSEGDDITLVPTISPTDATNKDVIWSSSKGSVATVNSSGKVTAVSAGETTITVKTVDGEKTATCKVTVKSSQGTGGGGTTPVSGSDTITYSTLNLGSYADGSTNTYSWKQLMKGNNDTIQGNGSKPSALYNTTAFPGYISSIELTIGYASGGSAKARLAFGTTSQPTEEVINIGADTSYSLTSTGKLTIIPPSTTATYFKLTWVNGASYFSSIKINYSAQPAEPVPVTGITMSKTSLTLGVGKTDTLNVSYSPNNATTGKGVTWAVASANPTGCVTVDSSGNVKAVAAGTARIVATSVSNSQITASCNVTVEATPQAAWTIMMYVCGADLESESGLASGDFQEILKVAGQPSDVNIIIQTGGASSWSSTYGINASNNQRYHVENKRLVCDNSKVYSSYKSMGLSSTFADFVAWGLSEYPADKTGVILWNHGGAMRGVCYDEKSNDDSLLNSEVSSGLSSAFTKVGRSTSDKLEFIGYDACLMQSQDIAEFNSKYFNYMIASQESEAGYGWDYDNWVDDLYAKRNTETILTAIVDSFIQDNGGPSSRNGDQTLSWLNLAYMPEYKTAWESFASALKTKFGNKVSKNDFYTFMHNNVKYFGGENDDDEYFGMFDVIDFVNKIENNNSYNPGGSYITNVRSAFSNLVKYSVAQKGAGNANGLCCIYSKTSGNWLLGSNYSTSQTNFTNWRSFVSTYGAI